MKFCSVVLKATPVMAEKLLVAVVGARYRPVLRRMYVASVMLRERKLFSSSSI